jgi:hypothetical protein
MAESLSQHDNKHVDSSSLSGLRVGERRHEILCDPHIFT